MPFKFSMLFQYAGQGWSESWYWNAPAVLPVTNTPPVFAASLIKARAAMLSGNVQFAGTRTTDVSNPRLTSLYIAQNTPGAEGAPDYPTTAWMAIAKGVGGVGIRQVWLHGAADTEVAFDAAANAFTAVGGIQGNFPAYAKILTAPSWCLRTVQGRKASANIALIPPLGISPAAGGVNIGTGYAGQTPTDNIIVGGFKFPLQHLNGTYLGVTGWQQTLTGILLLNRSISASTAQGYAGGASVRKQIFEYTQIGAVNLEFVRERRVGRTFFSARGRRSAR